MIDTEDKIERVIQAGAVLVFRPGVTVEQAEAAIARLRDVLDADYYLGGVPRVHTFDASYGDGPVWYIP